jgi:hypothetical protein
MIKRPRTYAALSQVFSADLNTLNDLACGTVPHLLEHFFNLDDTLWTAAGDAGGSAGISVPHALTIASPNVANDEFHIITAEPITVLAQLPRWRARIKIVNAFTSRIDIIGITTGTPTATRLAFVRDSGLSSNFKIVCGEAGDLEEVDTGFAPAADVWYILTAEFVSTTSVEWSVKSTEDAAALFSGTVTLSTPVTDTATNLFFTVRVEALAASARQTLVDYISIDPGRLA